MEQIQQPDRLTPEEVTRRIVQSIVADSTYKPDLNWQVWFALEELVEENAITDEERQRAMDYYYRVFEAE